jgi:hypothetical protein
MHWRLGQLLRQILQAIQYHIYPGNTNNFLRSNKNLNQWFQLFKISYSYKQQVLSGRFDISLPEGKCGTLMTAFFSTDIIMGCSLAKWRKMEAQMFNQGTAVELALVAICQTVICWLLSFVIVQLSKDFIFHKVLSTCRVPLGISRSYNLQNLLSYLSQL